MFSFTRCQQMTATIDLRWLIYGLSDNNLVPKWRILSSYSDRFRMQLWILVIVHVLRRTLTYSVIPPPLGYTHWTLAVGLVSYYTYVKLYTRALSFAPTF